MRGFACEWLSVESAEPVRISHDLHSGVSPAVRNLGLGSLGSQGLGKKGYQNYQFFAHRLVVGMAKGHYSNIES